MVLQRNEINEKDTWDLSTIFETNQKWEEEFACESYMTRKSLKARLTAIFGPMSLRKLIKKAEAIPQTDDEYVYINQVQYV